jgi:hypothetical protein
LRARARGTIDAGCAAHMRFAYALLLVVACGDSSSSGPDAPIDPPDAPPAGDRCTSSHAFTADPACAEAPNMVITFALYHPERGASHGVPGATFPAEPAHVDLARPSVAVDACSPVMSAAPACPDGCPEGNYCYPDGTCHDTPWVSDHDVGPIDISVDGTAVGQIVFEGNDYVAAGDLATRLDPIWTGGETVRIANSGAGGFSIEGVAPEVPEVTSFIHSVLAQNAAWGEDLVMTWTVPAAGDVVEITAGTFGTYTRCVAADDGSFTLPWPLLQELIDTGIGEFFVFFDRTRRSVGPSATGATELLMRGMDSQGYAFIVTGG